MQEQQQPATGTAFGNLGRDEIDLLHAVAHPDRKDEEGHQNRQRVQPITQQFQNAELPDKRCQRTK